MTRRVVTGHRNGRGTVLFDGQAPNRKLRKASGLISTLLWVTDESPAGLSGLADRAEREIGVAPPPLGSIFRVVEFPPGRKEVSRDAVLREMGLTAQGESNHPGMNPQALWYGIALHGDAPERHRAAARTFPGNFLFSTGPNTQGGGTRDTRGHYDVPMRDCSVELDGKMVIDRGRIVDEKMRVARVQR